MSHQHRNPSGGGERTGHLDDVSPRPSRRQAARSPGVSSRMTDSAPPRARKPHGEAASNSLPAALSFEMTFYSPAQVAEMWGVSHDKVLEFIKTGELHAFDVASKKSRRPQFKIPGDALKAFQDRRSGRDPARSLPPPAPRRTSRKSSPSTRTYF